MFKICSHWQNIPQQNNRSTGRYKWMSHLKLASTFLQKKFLKIYNVWFFSPPGYSKYSVFMSTTRHILKYIVKLLWTWQSSQSVVYLPYKHKRSQIILVILVIAIEVVKMQKLWSPPTSPQRLWYSVRNCLHQFYKFICVL